MQNGENYYKGCKVSSVHKDYQNQNELVNQKITWKMKFLTYNKRSYDFAHAGKFCELFISTFCLVKPQQ